MLKKKMMLASILAMMVTISACRGTKPVNKVEINNEKQIEVERQEKVEKDIMEEAQRLGEGKVDLEEFIRFMDKNISDLSRENATVLVNTLEEMQKSYLENLEENFFAQEVQEALMQAYEANQDLNNLNQPEDKVLEELLMETKNKGYRIETAEGTYFPIMDYGFYQKYSPYVTEDMKEYIEIMAVESSRVPAKDAALMIGWDEVIHRALRQEEFLKRYPDSIQGSKIKELFSKYARYAFYGLDNTPLFDYRSNQLNERAKTGYLETIARESDSELVNALADFMNLLEKNKDKLNEEVDNFRKNALEKIQNS